MAAGREQRMDEMHAKRPAWVSDELFPFESRFVDVDGHLVHYVDEGTGPTLLLLHGAPTWSFVYRDVIERLRSDFRCIAPDYPGFGLSEPAPGYRYTPAEHAQVIRAFVEQLDLEDVTLVIHDWGGPIGLTAAEEMPARFAGLVVANTWAWPVNGDLHFEMFSRTIGGALGRELIRRFNVFVNVMIPAGHKRRKPTSAEMDHYRAQLSSRERRHANAMFPWAITHSRELLARVEHNLHKLANLPALIVWAEDDVAFRDQELLRWETILTDHQTVRLPGVGHFLQSDAPDEVADAIRTWHESRRNAQSDGIGATR